MSEGQPTLIQYSGGKAVGVSVIKMCLTVVDGPDKGRELVLGTGRLVGGSLAGCELLLTDQTVSRRHFEIEVDGRGFLLRDLGSTNGTFLDGLRLGSVYLKGGVEFRVGRTVIRFEPLDEREELPMSSSPQFGSAIGHSIRMREVFGLLERAAPTNITVLLEGETGTGKGLIARSIHDQSPRKDGPFVVVDCGALPRNLIESELFGHAKGAFTGADTSRRGAFETGNKGTVFLDEIGELPLDLQPALLRVLEQREVKPLGSAETVTLDIRIVAATNRDLHQMVAEYTFREDLYFRLAGARVRVPPLRERREDIRPLVDHFLAQLREQWPGEDAPSFTMSEDALAVLEAQPLPGNSRQLRNLIERAALLSEGEEIGRGSIRARPAPTRSSLPTYELDVPFKEAKQRLVDAFERVYLKDLLHRNKGNVSQSAREAGVARKHLRDLLKKHSMSGG